MLDAPTSGRLVGSAREYEVAERRPTVADACSAKADVAQLAEHVLGKDEVTSSILVIGSILRSLVHAEDVHRSAQREGGWAGEPASKRERGPVATRASFG
jgi:hypothetical protein